MRYLGFVCLVLLVGCHKEKPVKVEKTVKVTTVVVEPKTIPQDFVFTGVVESSHSVEIRSRVQGYLMKVAYTPGTTVQAGDVLFEIDPREFESNVKEAQANLEREKAVLAQAQKAVDRYKPLFEQKAASRKDLDDAMTQLLSEQAAVSLYQAKLDEALLTLSYATIRSPISGATTDSEYSEGSLIMPGANGFMTTVSVLDPISISINVSESYFLESLDAIKKGELVVPGSYDFDVTLTLSDGSEFPYHGKVSFVSPVFDAATGTLNATGDFPNPNKRLKPGQFIRATAKGAYRPNAVLVPQQSVQQGPDGLYVFVVKKGKAHMQTVKMGDWYTDQWIVLSGLKAGDVVIVDGVGKVQEGTPVEK